MFDANQTPDVLFRIVALAFPVLGVMFLLLAAHIVGGALKPRGRCTQQPELPQSFRSRVRRHRATDRAVRRERRLPQRHQT